MEFAVLPPIQAGPAQHSDVGVQCDYAPFALVQRKRRRHRELPQVPQNLKCPLASLGCCLGPSFRFQTASALRKHLEKRTTPCNASNFTGRGTHVKLPPIGSAGKSRGAQMLSSGGEHERLMIELASLAPKIIAVRVKLHVMCQSIDSVRPKRWHIGNAKEGWTTAKEGCSLFLYCPGYGGVLAVVDHINRYASARQAVIGTVNLLHGKTCSIVPSDEEGEVGLSVDQVCAYYKRLLKKGAENTCYAINYRIEKKFGGFAADLAKSGCTLNH